MAVSNKFIVDASFVLAFLLPDEKHEDVDLVFNKYKEGAIKLSSTPLLPFEVANGLKLAVSRKRIDTKYALNRLKEFLNYKISLKGVDFFEVFGVAQRNNLTVYDACYLYLAKEGKLKLLTRDITLQRLA